MKIYKYLLLLFLSIGILSSCSKKSRILDKLEGSWAIEEMSYNNIDYMDSIGYNLLSFKKNEIEHFIIIPKMLNYKKEYAQIEVFYKNESYYLKIHSLNEILNNEYKIEFIKDYERKLLGIRLASDRLTLVAYKFHQDYNIDGFAW